MPSAAGIACDPVLLQILLRNLIDNALLHAGPGVRILIQTRRADGELQLAVRDDGPGIAADQRELALQPFHRLDSQVRSGAGLGLAIVQRIARASGARLCCEDGIGDRGLEVVLFPVAAWP